MVTVFIIILYTYIYIYRFVFKLQQPIGYIPSSMNKLNIMSIIIDRIRLTYITVSRNELFMLSTTPLSYDNTVLFLNSISIHLKHNTCMTYN